MARSHVLLFGFEPFLQFKENPSEKIARAMNGTSIGGCEVVGRVLPVDYGRVEDEIVKEMDRHEPAVALGTGLAAGRSLLSVEKIAVNYKYSEEPDNNGRLERGSAIDAKAPDGLFSNLKVEEVVGELNRRGIPSSVSLSAGAYLCNFAMFIITREALRRRLSGGFIHLPCDEEMASKQAYRRFPFMNLESMQKGIRIAIENALDVEGGAPVAKESPTRSR